MAKGSEQSIPTPPTATSGVSDWLANYPRIVESMEQYLPREMMAQVKAQEQAYPEETAMKQQLMGQISEGMGAEPPDWYQSKYQDYYKSLLGENVKSGIGADYYSTGMMEQNKNWGDYWRNLAASFAGAQPVYQANNMASQFTPGQVMSNNMAGYQSYLPAWSQQSQQNWMTPFMYMQGAGNVLSGLGSLMPMGGGGATSSPWQSLNMNVASSPWG